MNAIFITLLVREIEGETGGRRVAALAAPEPDVVVMKLERAAKTLVLDAGIDAPRIGWEPARLPTRASRFSATALALLAGATVARIEQPAGDRWVHIHFDNGWRLVWENLGRRANIVLLDGDTIVACLRQYAVSPW